MSSSPSYDPYLGLPYVAGLQDCYSVCRRYIQDHYEIRLPNFARPNNFWEDPHLDLYGMYKEFGFELVLDKPFEIGDVLLMPILTKVNSHAALVVEGNQVLHHLPGALSSVDPLLPKWANRANLVLRHPGITSYRKSTTTKVNVHEVIDAEIFRNPKFQKALDDAMESNP